MRKNKTEKERKNMEKENNTYKSDFSENETIDLNSIKPLNLNQKQTSELLTAVAVMMRKNVLNIK